MRLETDVKLDYKDVLIRPKRSTLNSRAEVSLEREFEFRNFKPNFPDNIKNYHYRGVPIMAANMDGVGTFKMADTLASQGVFTCLVKTYSADELTQFFKDNSHRTQYVAMSIGVSNADYEKFCKVYLNVGENLQYLCIDVANGYTETFVNHVKNIRERYPHIVIIAGNVVTGEMTEELILAGADIVKVGIGPGSVCTTRIQTGVGYPQLSAVIECADAAHGLGGHIIADGGCTCPGDVAKAFAAGADFVMLGGMFAGHNEGGGNVITKHYKTGEVIFHHSDHSVSYYEKEEVYDTKKFVQFYGMSSKAANDKHFGGLKDYRASEGREVLVPYRGSITDTVQELLGGIRSTCTYAGAKTLKQLSKCTTFVRVTQQFNSVYASNGK
jgi:GMP reductase